MPIAHGLVGKKSVPAISRMHHPLPSLPPRCTRQACGRGVSRSCSRPTSSACSRWARGGGVGVCMWGGGGGGTAVPGRRVWGSSGSVGRVWVCGCHSLLTSHVIPPTHPPCPAPPRSPAGRRPLAVVVRPAAAAPPGPGAPRPAQGHQRAGRGAGGGHKGAVCAVCVWGGGSGCRLATRSGGDGEGEAMGVAPPDAAVLVELKPRD